MSYRRILKRGAVPAVVASLAAVMAAASIGSSAPAAASQATHHQSSVSSTITPDVVAKGPGSVPPTGNGPTFPFYHIHAHGEWIMSSPTSQEYLLQDSPWGTKRGDELDTFGHVQILIYWSLSHDHDGTMVAHWFYTNSGTFENLSVDGHFDDGKPGTPFGGSVISGCHKKEYNHVYGGGGHIDSDGAYCVRSDATKTWHNMTLLFRWHRPGFKGSWVAYVRSICSFNFRPGRHGYRLVNIADTQRYPEAGLAGNDSRSSRDQDHMYKSTNAVGE